NNLDISQHKAVEIETMSVVCNHCSVKKWKDEPPGLCWNNGNVSLLPIEQPPEPLLSLMEGDTEKSRHFLSNIRKYNSCFQMTSFGASKQVNEPGHMPTLKIQGQVYQRTGLLWKSFRAYKTCSTSITIYQCCKILLGDHKVIIRAHKTPAGEHKSRFNAPTTIEVVWHQQYGTN
uniref:Uncharacterized protein n=1 Tax=Lepisosteus oculatus TaxID=7918 RepID=W5M5S7_LEPOC